MLDEEAFVLVLGVTENEGEGAESFAEVTESERREFARPFAKMERFHLDAAGR